MLYRNGAHAIDVSAEVSERVLSAVMQELARQHILIEGILLKVNMVTPGAACKDAATKEEIAWKTVRTL